MPGLSAAAMMRTLATLAEQLAGRLRVLSAVKWQLLAGVALAPQPQ